MLETKIHSAPLLIRRLLREHIRPYRKQVLTAIACMVVVSITTALVAYMIRPVVDQIFIERNAAKLVKIPLEVFAIIVVGAIANYGNTLSMRFIGQRIVADMQVRLFSHLMKSDLALFHSQSSGRLISRFTNDINLLRNAFSNVLTALTKDTLTTIFLACVLFYQNPKLALIALLAFPLAIYPLMRLAKRMRKISNASQARIGDFTTTLDEIFQGVRTVKSYNREGFEVSRARAIIESLFTLYFKAARVQAAAAPMMEILSGVSIALVIWYGGTQVLAGVMTPGEFTSFLGTFLIAYKPVRSMTGMNGALQDGLVAANRLFNVLDTKPTIIDSAYAAPLIVTKGQIRYEHVDFHYAADAAGVKDVTFDVPAGKTAALVGLSGAGKSTLMNLLMRFYDIEGGSITIDGQDIRTVTLKSLRDALAFVPQESMLFDDTVRANIAYGKDGASEQEIVAAARNAAADDFISALPQGYDTMIGSHGVKLSGGQRQRLAIARAMLKNAPILLLDEATSSLDNESERWVQQALSQLMKDRTTLVIAHRLSTIAGADVVYVVDGGRIVESGTHQELLAKRGKYAQLYGQNFAQS